MLFSVYFLIFNCNYLYENHKSKSMLTLFITYDIAINIMEILLFLLF